VIIDRDELAIGSDRQMVSKHTAGNAKFVKALEASCRGMLDEVLLCDRSDQITYDIQGDHLLPVDSNSSSTFDRSRVISKPLRMTRQNEHPPF
jgi:hypothetical protein